MKTDIFDRFVKPNRRFYFAKFLIYLVLFLMLIPFSSCKKNKDVDKLSEGLTGQVPDDEVLKIPVVFHILYNDPIYNVSDGKILTQITALNLDYRGLNTDKGQLPGELINLAADFKIQFELANLDPQGLPTTGIERRFTNIDGLDGSSVPDGTVSSTKALYNTSKGGLDIWPPDKYLNLYVALLPSRTGGLLLAGYTQAPGGDPGSDAVVIDPRCFGTVAPLQSGFELGRTATHEIGHWLSLRHVFETDDLVADTPAGGMPFNFMDYSDDSHLLMFTNGQRERVRNIFSAGGSRRKLYENIH